MYHFLSAYTAKVAGTEAGVTEPSATFSACFGGQFMALNPTVYGELRGPRYDATTAKLIGMLRENFEKYAVHVSAAVDKVMLADS